MVAPIEEGPNSENYAHDGEEQNSVLDIATRKKDRNDGADD